MAAETSAERGAAVRQRLLRAAAELIPERGWGAVTTRTLAQRAGVRPGLVHYHFASLAALLREAALARVRELLDAGRSVIEDAPDPASALERLLGALDQFSGTDAESLLVTEAYLAAVRDGEMRRSLRELMLDFRRTLAAAFSAGGHPSPEQTAAVLAAAVDGVILHRTLDPQLDAAAVAPVLRRALGRSDPPGNHCPSTEPPHPERGESE